MTIALCGFDTEGGIASSPIIRVVKYLSIAFISQYGLRSHCYPILLVRARAVAEHQGPPTREYYSSCFFARSTSGATEKPLSNFGLLIPEAGLSFPSIGE